MKGPLRGAFLYLIKFYHESHLSCCSMDEIRDKTSPCETD